MNTASYGLNVPSESRQHEVLQHKQVPSDIASGPLEAPKQPRVKFPSCSLGRGRQQTFNPKWYWSHPWLEYSAEHDAAFCYPCRVFRCGSSRSEVAFTRTGFQNWKHAMGKTGIISPHAKCATHKQAPSNAHCLDLCLVDNVKTVWDASEIFGLLESLYVFLTPMQFSLNDRPNYIQTSRLGSYLRHGVGAVNAVCYTYNVVLASLLEVSSTFDGIKVAKVCYCKSSPSTLFYVWLSLIHFLPVQRAYLMSFKVHN